MTATDRRYGLIGNTAIKAPCRVCATSNITLSGEQSVDGVAVVTDDRVLVTAQTSSVDNGIYVADTGAWVRASDMDGTYDIVTGTLVKVNSGTSNSGFWYVSTTGTPVIGTDAINFGMASSVLAVVSAFMQTMLDDVDAATARTTLGLGTMAVEAAANYVTKATLTTTGDSFVASAANTPARLAATANVAAHATTMDLWTARVNVLTGGAVTITDIADAPYVGAVTWVKMNAAHTWDDGAIFNVQGGADYTAAADDWIRIYATTASTFEVTVFKANGAQTTFAAGQVLQIVTATDAGSNTNAATLTNITSGVKQITPKSASSTLIVECTFDATVAAGGAGQNTTGVFQLYNNTAAANIGQPFNLGVVSGAGADVQTQAPGVIRALVTNSALTAIDFTLRAKYGTAVCTVTGANHVWTITEVQS